MLYVSINVQHLDYTPKSAPLRQSTPISKFLKNPVLITLHGCMLSPFLLACTPWVNAPPAANASGLLVTWTHFMRHICCLILVLISPASLTPGEAPETPGPQGPMGGT